MDSTLADIVRASHEIYGMEVTRSSLDLYSGFFERQSAVHHYNYPFSMKVGKQRTEVFPFFEIMIGKLMCFSYLTGQTAIMLNDGEGKRIQWQIDL